jgi:hypothetical protein
MILEQVFPRVRVSHSQVLFSAYHFELQDNDKVVVQTATAGKRIARVGLVMAAHPSNGRLPLADTLKQFFHGDQRAVPGWKGLLETVQPKQGAQAFEGQ